jgi:hypothetical protein
MTERPELIAALADLWARSGAVGRVPIRGESMATLLRDGDTVRVRAGAVPRVGDIVIVRTSEGLIAHRLVSRRGGQLVLRGDASLTFDPPLAPDAALGVVTAVETIGRPWRRFDGPLARLLGLVTVAYARLHHAAGRGPRPAWLPRLALGIEARLLPPMSPEEAFLVLMARQHIAPPVAARARAIVAEGIDWGRVIEMARVAQLGPLLFAGTRQLGDDAGIPMPVQDQLRMLYTGNWARSRRVRALLVEMLARLAGEGVPVLAHKGAALAATVFADPALRIAGDLDLSVPDADRARAEHATDAVRQPLAAANPDRRDPAGYHIELDGTVHHDLDPSRYGAGHWQAGELDWSGIWQRAEGIDVDGQPMLIPCPTDLLLTLVANAVRRGFTPCRLVSDLAETIAHHGETIDWPAFAAATQSTRLDQRSWIALGLAAEWFGADVPAHLLEPPPNQHLLAHERLILAIKQRHPSWRTPSRMVWAGSRRRALRLGLGLAWAMARHRR